MRRYGPALLTTVSALLLAGGLTPAGPPAPTPPPRPTRPRPRRAARARADRPALRTGHEGRVSRASAGPDRQAGPDPRAEPPGRDACELPLVAGRARHEAAALEGRLRGPRPGRDEAGDRHRARHRRRRSPRPGPARRPA